MTQRTIGQLIGRQDVVDLPPTATVREASEIMSANHVGAVLVMDGDRLEGIFTERDALNRVLAERRDPDTTPLSAVLSRNLVTLGPETSAVDALRLMSEVGIRHLPIMDSGRVYGVISLRDFVGAELQQVGQSGEG